MGYDEIPPDHDYKKEIIEKPQVTEEIKQEEKAIETTKEKKTDNEALLFEWAEKIYQATDTVWKTLNAFKSFPKTEEAEKFRNEMHGKKFGKFVSVFQRKSGIFPMLQKFSGL